MQMPFYSSYCQRKATAQILKPLGMSSINDLVAKQKWPAMLTQNYSMMCGMRHRMTNARPSLLGLMMPAHI